MGLFWDGCGFIYDHEVIETTDLPPARISMTRPALVGCLCFQPAMLSHLGVFFPPGVRAKTCLLEDDHISLYFTASFVLKALFGFTFSASYPLRWLS